MNEAERKFILEVAQSKNDAAQISALDILVRSAELSDKIMDAINASHLQPVLILGVLETVKFHILYNARNSAEQLADSKR